MKELSFILSPDFSKITPEVALIAMGQAFFSLSLGMGCMITYGSYLSPKEDLATSALFVVIFDTMIALLVGMVIFPAVFAMGLEPAEGTKPCFQRVTRRFYTNSYGRIMLRFCFSSYLAIAASYIWNFFT